MSNWFRPKGHHWIVLLMVMGMCSIALTLLSLDLVKMAIANVNFLTMHGLMAVMDGGLVPLVLIGFKAFVALLFYIAFKGIEHELLIRWNGHSP